MTTGWKAFRIDQKGQLRFLFHAHRPIGQEKGSSLVPLDRWIETPRRWGSEGQGKRYRVAFHFLRNEEDIADFQQLTKNKYVIIPIRAIDVEPKKRSSVGSWLARRLYVSSEDVIQALRNKTES